MLVRARQFALPICTALAICIALLIVHSSGTFHDCIERSQYKEAQETFPKKVAPVPVTFFMIKECWGDYADRNANAIIALFTIILAASTSGLWFVTGRTAKIAEKSLTELERAFVSFKFKIMGIHKDGMVNRYEITPLWENGGRTPTRSLYIHSSLGIFFEKLPDDFTFPDIWPSGHTGPQIHNPSYIGPKDRVEEDPLVIKTTALVLVRLGSVFIYIWGWAEYDDVFPETPPHRTEFCHQVEVFGNPILVREDGQTVVRLRLCGPHIGADNECYRKARPRELRSQPIV